MIHNDLRHVDVAILYGQGQTTRAHAIARKLYRQYTHAGKVGSVLVNSTTNMDFDVSVTDSEGSAGAAPINSL